MRSTRLSLLVATLVATSAAALSQPALAADAGSYQLNKTTTPDGVEHVLRWDPCQDAITYRVNVKALQRADRDRAIRETKVSFRRLAQATGGLRFRYEGKTTFVPRTGNGLRQPAEIVVAFVRPGQTDWPLGGGTAGYGGNRTEWSGPLDGPFLVRAVSGFVVVDAPQTNLWDRSLTHDGVTRPTLLAHELGHAIGLSHVDDPRQVMNPALTEVTPHTYALGDLAGLQQLGRQAGCIGPD